MITCSTVRGFEELYNKHNMWNASKSKALSKFTQTITSLNVLFINNHERQDTQY